MRNLKRALSLALASVMVLGLMIVGTSAASKDFADGSEIEYTEAVDVMNAIGVLEGDETGHFNPTDTLNREQAAKIIASMLLGPDNADKLGKNETIFTDVAKGSWAAGYISYCSGVGIIDGDGTGKFLPQVELTGVAFGKLLLCALGYDSDIEGYTGTDWAVNVASDMVDAGIDVDGVTFSDPLTREQAAQMAFNTLQADLVDYDQRGVQIGDVTIGASKAQPVTTTQNYGDNIKKEDGQNGTSDKPWTVQFGERYFPDLEKLAAAGDDFGRPVYTWENEGDKVGEYSDKEAVLTYTVDMTTKDTDVAKDLKNYKVRDYVTGSTDDDDVDRKIDANGVSNSDTGNIVTNNGDPAKLGISASKTAAKAIAELTGNGKAVEIYANKDKIITEIVVLEYTVDKITGVTTSKDGDYQKTTYTGALLGAVSTFTDPDKDDEVVLHGDIAKDSIVTFVDLDDDGTTKPVHVYATEQVDGAQSAHNDKSKRETITVDGTVYSVGTGVKNAASGTVKVGDFPNSKDEAHYYIDQYGFVVRTDAIESTDYVVVDAIRWATSTTALDDDGSASARLIFSDASTQTVTIGKINGEKVGVSGSNGTAAGDYVSSGKSTISTQQNNNAEYKGMIATYTVDSEGKYNLTVKTAAVLSHTGDGSAKVVEKGRPALAVGGITGNASTVYVVKTNDDDDAVYNAYTGYQNIPSVTVSSGKSATVSYVAGTGAAKFIFIDAFAGADTGDTQTGDMVYVFDANDKSVEGEDEDTVYQNVALNGEIANVTSEVDLNSKTLYEVKRDNDGVITGATEQKGPGEGAEGKDTAYVKGTMVADAGDGVVNAGNGYSYTYGGSETVYLIDDEDITEVTADNALAGYDVYVKVVDRNSNDASKRWAIDTMYIVIKETEKVSITYNDSEFEVFEDPACATKVTTSGKSYLPGTTLYAKSKLVADDKYWLTFTSPTADKVTVVDPGTPGTEAALFSFSVAGSSSMTVTASQGARTFKVTQFNGKLETLAQTTVVTTNQSTDPTSHEAKFKITVQGQDSSGTITIVASGLAKGYTITDGSAHSNVSRGTSADEGSGVTLTINTQPSSESDFVLSGKAIGDVSFTITGAAAD